MVEPEIVGEVAAQPEADGAVVAPASATTHLDGRSGATIAELPGEVE